MKRQLYAIVEKGTNIAIAMVDENTKTWLKNKKTVFDIVPIVNTGTTSFRTEYGIINAVSLITDDIFGTHYYMITDYPDNMTGTKAYDLIVEKK